MKSSKIIGAFCVLFFASVFFILADMTWGHEAHLNEIVYKKNCSGRMPPGLVLVQNKQNGHWAVKWSFDSWYLYDGKYGLELYSIDIAAPTEWLDSCRAKEAAIVYVNKLGVPKSSGY